MFFYFLSLIILLSNYQGIYSRKAQNANGTAFASVVPRVNATTLAPFISFLYSNSTEMTTKFGQSTVEPTNSTDASRINCQAGCHCCVFLSTFQTPIPCNCQNESTTNRQEKIPGPSTNDGTMTINPLIVSTTTNLDINTSDHAKTNDSTSTTSTSATATAATKTPEILIKCADILRPCSIRFYVPNCYYTIKSCNFDEIPSVPIENQEFDIEMGCKEDLCPLRSRLIFLRKTLGASTTSRPMRSELSNNEGTSIFRRKVTTESGGTKLESEDVPMVANSNSYPNIGIREKSNHENNNNSLPTISKLNNQVNDAKTLSNSVPILYYTNANLLFCIFLIAFML